MSLPYYLELDGRRPGIFDGLACYKFHYECMNTNVVLLVSSIRLKFLACYFCDVPNESYKANDKVRVFRLGQPIGAHDNFHVVNHSYPGRLQGWQLFGLLQSFTMILCISKGVNATSAHYLGPVILLVGSILQLAFLLWQYPFTKLAFLLWQYPFTKDVVATWLIVCLSCFFYLLVAFTDIICFKNTKISITLEISLLVLTICMHVLRFSAQEMFQFNWIRLGVAIAGASLLVPVLLSWHALFSEPDAPKTLVDLILRGDILFKMCKITNSLFRLLDVIFICVPATRGVANFLQGILHECFR